MLSKCLNPACSRPFRYLRDGRLYQLEISSSDQVSKVSSRREFFWLCGECCAKFTVVFKNGEGTIQPRFLELPSGETAEHAEEEMPFFG